MSGRQGYDSYGDDRQGARDGGGGGGGGFGRVYRDSQQFGRQDPRQDPRYNDGGGGSRRDNEAPNFSHPSGDYRRSGGRDVDGGRRQDDDRYAQPRTGDLVDAGSRGGQYGQQRQRHDGPERQAHGYGPGRDERTNGFGARYGEEQQQQPRGHRTEPGNEYGARPFGDERRSNTGGGPTAMTDASRRGPGFGGGGGSAASHDYAARDGRNTLRSYGGEGDRREGNMRNDGDRFAMDGGGRGGAGNRGPFGAESTGRDGYRNGDDGYRRGDDGGRGGAGNRSGFGADDYRSGADGRGGGGGGGRPNQYAEQNHYAGYGNDSGFNGRQDYGTDRGYGNARGFGAENDFAPHQRPFGADAQQGGGAFGGGRVPFGANEERYGNNYGGSNRRGPGGPQDSQGLVKCYNCQDFGHMSRACPNPEARTRAPRFWKPKEMNVEEMIDHERAALEGGEDTDVVVSVTPVGDISNVELNGATEWGQTGLDQRILDVLDKCGYKKPKGIQKAAIPNILEGHDILGQSETGTGKTAAFVLPIIQWILRNRKSHPRGMCEPFAIVVLPTRELAKQICNQFEKFSSNLKHSNDEIRVAQCYGQTSYQNNIRDLERADVGCFTMGRLMDLISKQDLVVKSVRFLVIDEAQQMLDTTNGAHGSSRDIMQLARDPDMPKTLLFSATYDDAVRELSKQLLSPIGHVEIISCEKTKANTLIVQEFRQARGFPEKYPLLRDMLLEVAEQHPRTLVFVKTKMQTDLVATKLQQEQTEDGRHPIEARSINGDRPQDVREEALRLFSEGKVWVLVATNVCERGLDIPGLEHVIQFDMPESRDTYVHRIGRTGRVRKGRATTFIGPDMPQQLLKEIMEVAQEAKQEVPEFMVELSEQASNVPEATNEWGDGSASHAPEATNEWGGGSASHVQQQFGDGAAQGGGAEETDDWGAPLVTAPPQPASRNLPTPQVNGDGEQQERSGQRRPINMEDKDDEEDW